MEDKTAFSELQSTLKSTSLDVLTDISELALPELIETIITNNSVITNIPILSWFITGVKTVSIISAAFSAKKFIEFIKPIKDDSFFTSIEAKELLEEICGSEKKLSFVIEQTFYSLDKYDAEIKAKWLSKLFIETFKNKTFTLKEYETLVFVIGNLNPITCKDTLEIFYESAKNKNNEELDLQRANTDYSSLAMSGLLRLPSGSSALDNIGGAHINELGLRFYENIFL